MSPDHAVRSASRAADATSVALPAGPGSGRFTALPVPGRTGLAVLGTIGMTAVTVLSIAEPEFRRVEWFVLLAMCVAAGLFGWWPGRAAAALTALAAVPVMLSAALIFAGPHAPAALQKLAPITPDGPPLVVLAAMCGAVLYSCPRWFSVAFVMTGAALTGAAAALANHLPEVAADARPGGSIGVPLAAVAIVAGLSFTAGGALFLVHRAEHKMVLEVLRADERRAAEQARDRALLMDDLHDVIARDITLVVMHARALEVTADPVARERSLAVIRSSAEQALAEVRRVLRAVAEPQSAADALAQLWDVAAELQQVSAQLERFGGSFAVAVRRSGVDREPAQLGLAPVVEQALARAIREGVANAVKHAGNCPSVSLDLDVDDHAVTLEIRNPVPAQPAVLDAGVGADSGKGVGADSGEGVGAESRADDSAEYGAGYGLARLRQRVALLGGDVATERTPDAFTLRVRLPRQAPAT